MTIVVSKRFHREYRKLPLTVQKKVDRQLRRLAENIQHPSLKARKMEGASNIWEVRVDLQFRLTFQLDGELAQLRRVGTHAIYQQP